MENAIPMDRLAKIYIKMRSQIQALTQKYEAEVADLKAQQDEVSNAMREQMKALGTKSVKTDFGTVSLTLKTRYSTNDWDSFRTFVVTNNAVDLLEQRIAQRNMAIFLEANPGLVPPGLNSDSEYAVSVRKPTN